MKAKGISETAPDMNKVSVQMDKTRNGNIPQEDVCMNVHCDKRQKAVCRQEEAEE